MLVDTHCHLDSSVYNKERDALIKSFSGIIINCGTKLETSRTSIDLAKKYENIFATCGLHPHYASKIETNFYDELEELLDDEKVVAVGECGLDFYRNLSPRETQEDSFRRLIKVANKKGLPLIIHSRDAMDETLKIVEEENLKKGVFHSFSGTIRDIKKIIELGFYISITGVVTFENSRLSDIISYIPKDRIMFETDSPYLAPEPYRGKRNIPQYVEYVVLKYADICKITKDEAEEINYKNAKEFFGI
ncbi:TPA: hypothetical protein DCX16_04060 [bacterium]|nr:hypothetical protein [bacterium]